MIKILNQQEFNAVCKNEGINDLVALKKRRLWGVTLVSCLESGCSYDGTNVWNGGSAEKLLRGVSDSYGMKLYGLEDGIQINWDSFKSLPKIQRDIPPQYLISCGNDDLPEVPKEYKETMF